MKALVTIMVLLCLIGCSGGNSETILQEEAITRMDIDLQWGGYYASKVEGEDHYGVFRLLDFNRLAYHVTMFQEEFSEVPTLEDVVALSPYIGHAPIDSRSLLRKHEVYLLGGPMLTQKDLEGYRFYLDAHKMKESDIEELFQNIIEFSNQPPYKVTLTLVEGELEVTER